jgi:NADPH2:quinone reductase
MEVNGQSPGKGPIVITGATGGVGSVAVSLLAQRGYQVIAVSGRPEHEAYLRGLGAGEVFTPVQLGLGSRPLEAARFGGVIDNVGGTLLAGLIRHVALWGNVAAIGNAASPDLDTTVYPFILRGVSVLGASSANCPMSIRTEIWNALGAHLKPPALDKIVNRTVALGEVVTACDTLMNRTALGRVLVDCR